jgi:hypothetical protein
MNFGLTYTYITSKYWILNKVTKLPQAAWIEVQSQKSNNANHHILMVCFEVARKLSMVLISLSRKYESFCAGDAKMLEKRRSNNWYHTFDQAQPLMQRYHSLLEQLLWTFYRTY